MLSFGQEHNFLALHDIYFLFNKNKDGFKNKNIYSVILKKNVASLRIESDKIDVA